MTGLGFRRAGAADVDAVAGLHADSWRRHYRGAYADAFLDGEVLTDRRQVWSDRLSAARTGAVSGGTVTSSTVTVLAEVDGAPAGFVHVAIDDDAQWGSLLDNLHVAHGHQRHGIGSALLSHAAQSVTQLSTTDAMYLWVLEQNTAAQAFYTAHGGKPAERGLVQPPGGVPERLNGQPASLRYVWPTVQSLATGVSR
jgi:ribosomal protein S18 acetylase RimI-like enzyme